MTRPPPTQPWRRIALPVVDRPADLSWSEAMANPCETCDSTACCTHLSLHSFEVATLRDLDYARYVLGFERMVLGITPGGTWHVYYRYPCRYLDRDTRRCTVHGTDGQPDVCKSFNPYGCWYRTSFGEAAAGTLIQVDRHRLDWIAGRCRFRDDRSIEAMPSQEAMREAFAELPVVEDPDRAPAEVEADPVYAAWRDAAIAGDGPAQRPARTYLSLAEPCDGCAAYCCTALVFPQAAPIARSQLDFFRFALGFPGVELGLAADGSWTILVRSRCRHLDGTRCGVFGTPERPLVCSFYDAHKCGYKNQLGELRPAAFVRVRHAEFDAVAACFAFDDHGMTVAAPGPDDVREAVEASWRGAAILEG
jgi:Fe-S-cluster containining protein